MRHPPLQDKNFAVIVFGDLGRCPRMQNHALVLADEGATVRLIGVRGKRVQRAIGEHPNISVHELGVLAPAPQSHTTVRLIVAGMRALSLFISLLRLLIWQGPKGELLLIQSPPLVPLLWAAFLAHRIKKNAIIIDWHNFGYTVLAQSLQPNSLWVRLYLTLEFHGHQRVSLHLAVSEALSQDLQARGLSPVLVLPDGPVDRHQRVWVKPTLELAPDRRTVIIPSSWSVDDDFDLLSRAIPQLAQLVERGVLPPLQLLLTGDGPLRVSVGDTLRGLADEHVRIFDVCLEYEEYLGLLRRADVGLSLHRSTSKLDVPIKIFDMMSAGLDIVALDYGKPIEEALASWSRHFLFADVSGLVAAFKASINSDASVPRTPRPDWETLWRERALPSLVRIAS